MFSRRWLAYSAVVFLVIGAACLVALVVQQPVSETVSLGRTQAQPKVHAAASVTGKSVPVRAPGTS